MIGQIVSHYKILDKLGEGGMGEVYLAEDMSLGRKVAVKFLSSDKASDAESRQRFVHEARAQAMLSHPNIATFHEVGEKNGQVFIVMEYIEGQPLSRLAQNDRLTMPEILNLVIQVGEGLQAAHEKGITHRDIKPENVLVTTKHHAKITDFGLAKWKGASTLTRTGVRMGTAYYMSPEQVEGEKIDHRTDIFSLGTILYELVCARRPFEGDTDAAIFYDLVHTHPHPVARYNREVPEKLEQSIFKCLAKKPEERYQHMDELLVDLRAVKKNLEAGLSATEGLKSASAPSIAVLPFTNMSSEAENEYFSDGLTEEIIAQLAKIHALKVISRTSIMRYKQTAKPLKLIATELGVRHILEGSVRKQGSHLRITAQLVDALEDAHLWAETYRGTVEDVFDIQEKVAGQIAEAMKLKLSSQEQKNLEKRHTENPAAYELYLKGRFWWNKRTEEGMKKGMVFFNHAIEKDPKYALAYVGLADAHILLGVYGYLPFREVMPKAEKAALRALELDATLSEAYASLAHFKMLYDWDWAGGEQLFQRSIELNPNYAAAHLWYSLTLSALGKLEEALVEIKRGRELDPLSLIINTDVGMIHYMARRYDQAFEETRKTLEIDPNFFVAHLGLGRTYLQVGNFEEAIAELRKALKVSSESTLVLATLGYAYARVGKRGEALDVLKRLEEVSKERYVSPYTRAILYTGLGETEQAFEWLDKAFKERCLWAVHTPLAVDPIFDPLRSDPRFSALLKKVGLHK